MKALELKIPPVLLTLLFGLLAYLVSRLTPGISIPGGLKLAVFIMLTLAAAAIGLAGVSAFRKANTTVNPLTPDGCSAMVDSGVFSHTRNPMYLALLLVLIGWGFYLANLFSLLMAAGFIFYMNRFQIQPEERALERNFGEPFNNYKKQVRRWL